MKSRFDVATIVPALGVAAYLAIALDYLALDEFELSCEVVRKVALAAAILIAALLALEFFGKKLRKVR